MKLKLTNMEYDKQSKENRMKKWKGTASFSNLLGKMVSEKHLEQKKVAMKKIINKMKKK